MRSVRRWIPIVFAPLLLSAICAAPAAGQTAGQAGAPELDWSDGVSELPIVDLTGTWLFVPEDSDPMVEIWQGRQVEYVVTQTGDRIVLDFRPEDGRRNVQGYRWNGTVSSFRRGDAEVRERARWTDGGRSLVIEGRWWTPDDLETINAYTFVYRLDGPNELVFVQRDEHGETTWRFERS